LIYYAGHGYTEIQRNENRGYITGIDTPHLDGTLQGYNGARLKAISMTEIRAPLERAPAKSILFIFDSCFSGTIFTNRAGNDRSRPLTSDIVSQLMERPARDFITAGRSDQRVPAHSPIPGLFLAALNCAADPHGHGVISAAEIHTYVLDRVLQMPDINLTPQVGRLSNPDFAEGSFLFRVLKPIIEHATLSETIQPLGANVMEDVGALSRRADQYREGRGGLPKDEREAARLYELAADRGNASAQNNLGVFYQNGRGGLLKDDREAARLYKLAADQGNATAQSNLGAFTRMVAAAC
jgi:hypothetical protein